MDLEVFPNRSDKWSFLSKRPFRELQTYKMTRICNYVHLNFLMRNIFNGCLFLDQRKLQQQNVDYSKSKNFPLISLKESEKKMFIPKTCAKYNLTLFVKEILQKTAQHMLAYNYRISTEVENDITSMTLWFVYVAKKEPVEKKMLKSLLGHEVTLSAFPLRTSSSLTHTEEEKILLSDGRGGFHGFLMSF